MKSRQICFFIVLTAISLQAASVNIDFDGPGYIAGELPPEPWFQESGSTEHSIEADVGYEGTQGLVITGDELWHGVAYQLPTPLTSELGAVQISILLNPPSPPSGDLFGGFGGLQVGRGSKSGGTATFNGLIFRTVNGNRGIYGPGSMWGTSLGVSWTPNQWYKITFEISEDWQTMTIGAGIVGETPVTDTFDWDGGNINKIWTASPNADSAVYDNLIIDAGEVSPDADLTGDGFVGLQDFAVISQWWLSVCDEANEFCDGADLSSSGQVELDDILIFSQQWLEQS